MLFPNIFEKKNIHNQLEAYLITNSIIKDYQSEISTDTGGFLL